MIFALGVLVCLWFPFQDLVLAALYHRGVPAMAIRGMLFAKEAIVVLVVLLALVRGTLIDSRFRACGADVLAGLYAVLITAYLPVGDADLQPRLAQYRSLALPVLLYFCGRALPATELALRRWVQLTVLLALGLAAFGFVERFVLDVEFWRSTVAIGPFLEDIKGQALHLVQGLPGNMYGDYGFGFFGFRRMSGAFGSPLTLGYYLAFPIVLMICALLAGDSQAVTGSKLRPSWLLASIAVCSGALMITVTRAGIGAVLIAVALALLLYRRVRLIVFTLLFCFGISVIFEDYIGRMLDATLTMNDSSMRGHYNFLLNSLDVVLEFPLGLGMGAAGGWAHTMSDRFSGAAENAFLVIVAQASIYAAVLFFGFCFAALAALRRSERSRQKPLEVAFSRAVQLSMIGYLTTGMLSEQILTFTSVGHFWISLGYAVSIGLQSRERPESGSEQDHESA